MGLEDEWITDILGGHKCRSVDCYAMLISVNLLAARFSTLDRAILLKLDTLYSLVTVINSFFIYLWTRNL